MGQSLQKFAPGRGENKDEEMEAITGQWHDEFMKDNPAMEFAEFYEAISKMIVKINTKWNATQFPIPDKEKVEEVYNEYYGRGRKPLTKEAFEKLLQELIMKGGVTGFESIRDMFLYIFGIPAAALLIKQGVAPKAISDDVFIPGVTSGAVFLLAKLHKL